MDVKRVVEGISESKILCLTYVPATREILVAGEDGFITSFEADTGRVLARVSAHTSWVTGLEATKDELGLVISCSLDTRIAIHGNDLSLLSTHNSALPVYCIAYDQRRRRLCAGYNKRVRIFQVQRPKEKERNRRGDVGDSMMGGGGADGDGPGSRQDAGESVVSIGGISEGSRARGVASSSSLRRLGQPLRKGYGGGGGNASVRLTRDAALGSVAADEAMLDGAGNFRIMGGIRGDRTRLLVETGRGGGGGSGKRTHGNGASRSGRTRSVALDLNGGSRPAHGPYSGRSRLGDKRRAAGTAGGRSTAVDGDGADTSGAPGVTVLGGYDMGDPGGGNGGNGGNDGGGGVGGGAGGVGGGGSSGIGAGSGSTGGPGGDGAPDGSSGGLFPLFNIRTDADIVRAIACSPTRIYISGLDQSIVVLDADEPQAAARWVDQLHGESSMTSMSVSQDPALVVTGGTDRALRVWSPEISEQAVHLGFDAPIIDAAHCAVNNTVWVTLGGDYPVVVDAVLGDRDETAPPVISSVHPDQRRRFRAWQFGLIRFIPELGVVAAVGKSPSSSVHPKGTHNLVMWSHGASSPINFLRESPNHILTALAVAVKSGRVHLYTGSTDGRVVRWEPRAQRSVVYRSETIEVERVEPPPPLEQGLAGAPSAGRAALGPRTGGGDRTGKGGSKADLRGTGDVDPVVSPAAVGGSREAAAALGPHPSLSQRKEVEDIRRLEEEELRQRNDRWQLRRKQQRGRRAVNGMGVAVASGDSGGGAGGLGGASSPSSSGAASLAGAAAQPSSPRTGPGPGPGPGPGEARDASVSTSSAPRMILFNDVTKRLCIVSGDHDLSLMINTPHDMILRSDDMGTVASAIESLVLDGETIPDCFMEEKTRGRRPRARRRGEANDDGEWSMTETLASVVHQDRITSATCIGPYVATGSFDRSVRCWDTETGALVWSLEDAHDEPVTGLAYAPEIDQLATVSSEAMGKVWSTAVLGARPTLRCVLAGQTSPMERVCWDPHNMHWITASEDRAIRTWNRDGTLHAVLYSQGGAIHALAVDSTNGWVLSSEADNRIRVYDSIGRKIVGILGAHNGQVNVIHHVPERGVYIACSADNTVSLWKEVRRLGGPRDASAAASRGGGSGGRGGRGARGARGALGDGGDSDSDDIEPSIMTYNFDERSSWEDPVQAASRGVAGNVRVDPRFLPDSKESEAWRIMGEHHLSQRTELPNNDTRLAPKRKPRYPGGPPPKATEIETTLDDLEQQVARNVGKSNYALRKKGTGLDGQLLRVGDNGGSTTGRSLAAGRRRSVYGMVRL